MRPPTVRIVGGGAAGFFAAITCAEANPDASVHLYEQSAHFLTKVARSGGGRCNVTHACFDNRLLATRYPRGERALISPLHRFDARSTVDWFEQRGVRLKTESDGRIFPRSDLSATIVDCLLEAARAAGVIMETGITVTAAEHTTSGFSLRVNDTRVPCDRLLLATGGSRVPSGTRIAASFGHQPNPPVPSLFSFDTSEAWVHALAGVSCEAEVSTARLRQSGPLLFTHRGLSGPAILRLSAWGARELAGSDYRFPLTVNFLSGRTEHDASALLKAERERHPGRKIHTSPLASLPARLWQSLCQQVGIPEPTRWTTLTRNHQLSLGNALVRTTLPIHGKSLNKDEFVTCGGISLKETNLKTMESRLQPGLYFAGELLDIDGVTGGFNFQSAWTTGWIAGHSLAAPLP
ncbi:MAG: NAD(P)/FAD-dependent oxidoreductase [Chthoniobacterales bacterium]